MGMKMEMQLPMLATSLMAPTTSNTRLLWKSAKLLGKGRNHYHGEKKTNNGERRNGKKRCLKRKRKPR